VVPSGTNKPAMGIALIAIPENFEIRKPKRNQWLPPLLFVK
jgi:hypothetical protein